MKAEENKLTTVFADNKTYEIPRYQRPYSWNETNTYDLINDTYEAFLNDDQEYFIGSIITIETEKDKRFDVVDGQQRLTTLTIILAKLRDLIESPGAKGELQKRILPINVFTETPESPRLLVREQDRYFFRRHILMGEEVENKTDLTETQFRFQNNSKVIEEYLKDKGDKQLRGFSNYLLEKVYVVYVKTDSFQSAYRLFNVLNVRGLSLSNADLIKNKLFDITSNISDHDTIEDKWNELEDIITISHLDVFFSHHRTSLLGDKQSQVLHKEFEKYIDSFSGTAVDFLEKTIVSAKNYKSINSNNFDSPEVKRMIFSLNNVSHDEWIPPLLCFMNHNVAGLDLVSFIRLLEKITYQNWIRRLGKTQRNTVYYNIITLIIKGNPAIDILNKIKEFKNNEEFKSFITGDIYGTQYAKAVLLKLEQEMQDLSVTKSYDGIISVEHVLPQKLSNEFWKRLFTEDAHKYWIHKLGNLTLLSGRKNSSAQNYDFHKKKEAYNSKNKRVSFDLTKEICALENWTLDIIEQRHKKLVNEAYNIWKIN